MNMLQVATGEALDALACMAGLRRMVTLGKRLWWTLWIFRARDTWKTDAELRERLGRVVFGVAIIDSVSNDDGTHSVWVKVGR